MRPVEPGAGLYSVVLAGTVVVVGVNVALRALGRIVDRRPDTGGEEPTFYAFLAVTKEDAEAHVRALLVQALTRTDFSLLSGQYQQHCRRLRGSARRIDR
jgi:putative Mg2+ transporter-C (MgtC) family protein